MDAYIMPSLNFATLSTIFIKMHPVFIRSSLLCDLMLCGFGKITVCLYVVTDVTEVLCDLELTIHKVKVSTTPDGKVMDLFFITDNRFLHFLFSTLAS